MKEADTTDKGAEQVKRLGDGEGVGPQIVTHVTWCYFNELV